MIQREVYPVVWPGRTVVRCFQFDLPYFIEFPVVLIQLKTPLIPCIGLNLVYFAESRKPYGITTIFNEFHQYFNIYRFTFTEVVSPLH